MRRAKQSRNSIASVRISTATPAVPIAPSTQPSTPPPASPLANPRRRFFFQIGKGQPSGPPAGEFTMQIVSRCYVDRCFPPGGEASHTSTGRLDDLASLASTMHVSPQRPLSPVTDFDMHAIPSPYYQSDEDTQEAGVGGDSPSSSGAARKRGATSPVERKSSHKKASRGLGPDRPALQWEVADATMRVPKPAPARTYGRHRK